MSEPARERPSRRPVDEAALARVRRRLEAADAAPWLHGEVARRMAERLPAIRLQPEVVIDWWSRLGGSGGALAGSYPKARRIAIEIAMEGSAAPAGAAPRSWWPLARRRRTEAEVVLEAGLAAETGRLLWSNMGLHFAADPQAVMRQWQRALQVDGFLMFSTLGPGTLETLRAQYRARSWPPPHAPFVDMHDLGDMLVEAGFADPVMDQETVTLTWATPEAALVELRQLGGNADPARAAGLRTPRWRAQLLEALGACAGADGRVALGFEIVYGHAFRPAPRARVSGETQLPLGDLRRMLRAGRP